jgi:WD40 repeat protein
MGVVYQAEQTEPIRRTVALKLIKTGMDTEQVVARFESERQALALMNHPNIARVYAAGATEIGRPYFVMEYVKGVPITEYCDKYRLTTTERLALFAEVCQGVQHAHQKGIIHRDIKPSNVLVEVDDGKAVPKIIDFGVARATEKRLTEKSIFTQFGALIGTPEYMSPEQAEMSALDIDTRTDVYSLGVLLYELMVGALPFDPKELRQAGFDEIRRRIREDEPSKPSTRISALGEASKESANQRKTDAVALARELRGDLDWITMKALEKDRTRRYASPNELAADIRRHLNDEPVVASPPSTAYRAKKFMRRHRLGVGFASGLAILIVVFAAVVFVLWRQADASRRTAQAEASRAEAGRLAALGQNVLEKDPTEALAYAIASLEHEDDEATRLLALQALWRGPPYSIPADGYVGAAFHGIDFSPDGHWLAAGLWDSGEVMLWPDDGGAPTTLAGHRGCVWRIMFDSRSEYLFSSAFAMKGGEKSSFRIWSLSEQRPLFERDFSTAEPANAIHVDRDLGRVITAWQTDEGATLFHSWPIEGGEPTVLGQLPLTRRRQTKYPPVDSTGTWLAHRGDREVHISRLDRLGPTTKPRLLGLHDHLVGLGMAFSADGARLATGDLGGELRIWSVSSPTQRPIRVLPSGEKAVRVVRWDPAGDRLAVGHLDAKARLIDLTGPPAADPLELDGLAVQVHTLAFHPNGHWLAGTAVDGVKIWPLVGPYPFVLRGHQDRVMDLRFGPDGDWLATCSFDRTVRRWSLRGKEYDEAWQVMTTHATSPCFALAADPRGRLLASVFDGVRITDPEDGSSTKLPGFNNKSGDYSWGLAVRSDGRMVAAGGGQTIAQERLIRLWDLDTGEIVELDSGDGSWCADLEFLPDGRLVSAGPTGLRLWTPTAGTSELLRESSAFRVDRDPVGQRVFFVESTDLTEAGPPSWGAFELDMTTGESRELTAHRGKPLDIALDPEGTRVVTGHGDGTVRVGPIDGSAAHLLIGHESPVRAVAVSPDGNWIASGSDDGIVRVWPMPQGQPFHTLPHGELLARLKSLTNVRIVRDDASSTGTRLDFAAFPGWEKVTRWWDLRPEP